MTQTEIINKVKDALYKKLSYTSQDYNAIINDIINVFKDSTGLGSGLTTRWDNISESDIMFIFMSILAAHKDILNYMLDYRVLEGYMSTAKERQSVVRIANSFGYKIPSFKASRALIKLTSYDDNLAENDVVIENFKVFADDSGVAWTYIDNTTDSVTIGKDDTIEVFQGSPSYLGLHIENFSEKNRTHIISNQSIAIGNNYNSKGCSKLSVTLGESSVIEFTEVDNIYSYNGTEDYVYELNVDPQGITYIRLPMTLDITPFEGKTIDFTYLVTSGASADVIDSISAQLNDIADDLREVTFTLSSSDEFIQGSDAYTIDEIRSNFKSYYASSSTLVTLDDYKNFILNIQKVVPNIEKCLIIDKQYDTNLGLGDSAMGLLDIAIYVLKADNAELTSGEEDDLIAELNTKTISGVSLYINENDSLHTNQLASQDIYVELDGTVTVDIATLISDYVEAKGIGATLTSEELNTLLSDNGYTFYGKILIGTSDVSITDTEITLEYYQYPLCPIDNVSEKAV